MADTIDSSRKGATTAPESVAVPANRSKATSRTIWGSLGAISLIAGAASYLGTLVVIQAARGHTTLSYFEAALADPTIAAASVNLMDAHRQGARAPRFSILSIAVAVVVTLGANVMSTDPAAVPKWLVNVWSPVAFLMAFESLMSYLRRGRAVLPSPGGPAPDPGDSRCPHQPGMTRDEAVRTAYEHERDCEGAAPTFTDLAARFSLDRKTVAGLVRGPLPEPVTASLNGSAPGA